MMTVHEVSELSGVKELPPGDQLRAVKEAGLPVGEDRAVRNVARNGTAALILSGSHELFIPVI